MAFLKHLLNGSTVSVYELNEKVRIGRHMDNDISIDDPIVSAFHAELRMSMDTHRLKDLDSTNGSFYKGKRIDALDLKGGEVFSIGSHEFEYHIDPPTDLDKTLKIKKSWIPGVYYTE